MNNKAFFIILILFALAFAQEARTFFWNDTAYYRIGDTVFFRNLQYIALEDGIKGSVFEYEDVNANIVPGEDDGIFWRRLTPLRTPVPQEIREGRMYPAGHHKMDDLLTDYDGFVRGVASIVGFKLNDLKSAGLPRESRSSQVISSGRIHSAWGNFMADGGSWDGIKGRLNDTIVEEIDTNSEALRREIYPIIRRTYNSYPRRRRFEQIIHNIGDAGIAFSHALGNLSESSGIPSDGRERGNEIAARKALKKSNWDNISSTYFTGSIYDAIAEYGVRTVSAINWAKENIKKDGSCSQILVLNYFCYYRYKDEFFRILDGHDYGVMRFAIAVGRFILMDAMLAERPLEHQRIIGEPFLRPNTSQRFTAYARDPDAVLLLHRNNTEGRLTENSKEILSSGDYVLWHEPSAHDMFYEWSINGNRIFPNSATENAYNAFTAITDSLTELNRLISAQINLLAQLPCCCDASPQQLQEKEVLREEILMLEAEHRSLQLRYNSLRAAYLSFIKSSDLEVKTAFSDELSETLRAGTDSVVSIRFFGSKNYNVRLTNSSFNLSVRIIDDEGSFAVVTRELTFRNTIPVANAEIRQNNSLRAYIALTDYPHTSFRRERHEKILSGFTDPSVYDNIYIDFFKESIDSNGHASDRIAYTELTLENDNIPWLIRGVNREITVGNEQRIISNNRFWISSGSGDSVTANLTQHFVSSVWHNDSSPVTQTRLCKIDISKGSYDISARVINREDNSSISQTISIPILVPPVVNSAHISTRFGVEGGAVNVYSVAPIVLSGGDNSDMLLELYASASGSDTMVTRTYRWEFLEEGRLFNDDAFENTDLWGSKRSFTHRALLDLDLGLEPGKTYDVFLLVTDNYGERDNYKFTRKKVGSFRLAHLSD